MTPAPSSRLVVAIAGNPNSGKTTLFNALTGATAHVGNYAGVTVELKRGRRFHAGREIEFVDLPGTYSLTAYSAEEQLARRFLVEQHPDVVVVVADASNLERHLYLALQIAELGIPRVLAFSMADVARSHGMRFDTERLGRLFGAPIIETVAPRGEGIEALLDTVVGRAGADAGAVAGAVAVPYGDELERSAARVLEAVAQWAPERLPAAAHLRRATVFQLLEQVPDALARFPEPGVLQVLDTERRRLRTVLGDNPEIAIAARRYGFISGACTETVRATAESRHAASDRIDSLVLAPFVGFVLLLALLYAVFWATFTLGAWPQQGLDWAFSVLGKGFASLWPTGSTSLLRDLLLTGILPGVGGVLTFLPNILILFFGIALLEDSGYMARAAFLMDRAMHRIGLHGKSFIPMLIGIGCTVPAILATRTLDTRRDRLTTLLVLPFVSCGARFAVYAMLIPAFFGRPWQAPVLMSLYVLGALLAVGGARLLRGTVLRGEGTPFVMELPPYRMPTLRGCVLHTWRRGREYVIKAGTIVLAFSVVMWFLSTFPRHAHALATPQDTTVESAQPHSYADRIGHAMEPVLRPMGFDARIGTALIGSIAGKELLISQLGVAFALGETDPAAPEDAADRERGELPLQQLLRARYRPLVGFCLLLFSMLSAPCLATFAVTWKESGHIKWAFFQTAVLTVTAFVVTTLVYQVGAAVGW